MIIEFGKLSASFGVLNAPCKMVADEFLGWQQDILREWGFSLELEKREGFTDALNAMLPLTAPISTKYLFWALNDKWTLYFDNGVNGTDAGPPCVLSARLQIDAIRAVMVDEKLDEATRHVIQYGATIFEFYSSGVERRHVFAANDGGKWKFHQSGEPLKFENTDVYKLKSIRDRFTNSMLVSYLRNLGIDLDNKIFAEHSSGYLIKKLGTMPWSYMEFNS